MQQVRPLAILMLRVRSSATTTEGRPTVRSVDTASFGSASSEVGMRSAAGVATGGFATSLPRMARARPPQLWWLLTSSSAFCQSSHPMSADTVHGWPGASRWAMLPGGIVASPATELLRSTT